MTAEEEFVAAFSETLEGILRESVARGHMEIVGVDEDGRPTYAMTAAGKAFVEAMGARKETP